MWYGLSVDSRQEVVAQPTGLLDTLYLMVWTFGCGDTYFGVFRDDQ